MEKHELTIKETQAISPEILHTVSPVLRRTGYCISRSQTGRIHRRGRRGGS